MPRLPTVRLDVRAGARRKPAANDAMFHGGEVGELEPGTVIAGRFVLDRRIGEGGMGVVWAATHKITGKAVALKMLKAERAGDAVVRARFLREARAVCAVRHPNIVQIHDVLEMDDGAPVMVMDLLRGESLGSRLARETRLPVDQVARILLPTVNAVGAAHAAGIVHRNLKPDNIFLRRRGRRCRGARARLRHREDPVARRRRRRGGRADGHGRAPGDAVLHGPRADLRRKGHRPSRRHLGRRGHPLRVSERLATDAGRRPRSESCASSRPNRSFRCRRSPPRSPATSPSSSGACSSVIARAGRPRWRRSRRRCSGTRRT